MMKKELHIKTTLLQLLVFRVVNKVFVATFLFSLNGFSQKNLLIDSLQKDNISISWEEMANWSNNGNGVIFFCTKDYKESAYLKQSVLFDFNKIDSVKPISLNYILFNEFDNNSKNPFLYLSGFKDSIINQIECYIICDNKSNVYRAIDLFSSNFFILNVNENKNLFQLSFKGICPKDLTYSISLYYDIIYEIFNPQYTNEEKIKFQEKSIIQLKFEIDALKKQLNEIDKKNQEENKIILERLKLLETSKKIIK